MFIEHNYAFVFMRIGMSFKIFKNL